MQTQCERDILLAMIPPIPPKPITRADVTLRFDDIKMLFWEYEMTAGTLLCVPAIVRNVPKYRTPTDPA
jgi:hypothetical protein